MTNKISRRTFLSVSAAGLLTAQLARAEEKTAPAAVWERRLTLSNAAEIRLLHFTDIHFFSGVDKTPDEEKQKRLKTQDSVRRMIDTAKPDMLIVTGDLWHNNPDGRGAEFMAYSIEQCSLWGVPWTFTWGNHDKVNDYALGHRDLTKAKGSLYAGVEKDGNYVVALEGGDGQRLVEIFCLNSRGGGMDQQARGFVQEAAQALDAQRRRPLRLSAFHIPLKQYKDVWDNGEATGILGETVAQEKEDGSSLSRLASTGIQAAICGHDHVNDYSGKIDGVDLIYGRSTGYAGYGDGKVAKGAKLYTLDPGQKTVKWASLLPNGTSWQPGEKERRDLRESKG